MADKTYIQNVGDSIEAISNPDSAYLPTLGINIATGFIPNLYRQTARYARNEVLDLGIKKSDDWDAIKKKAAMKAEMPFWGQVRKLDAWGRTIRSHTPTTSLAWRIGVPVRTGPDVKDIVPPDVALARWNEINYGTDKAWAPGYPDKYLGKGQADITDVEYERLIERSGQLALERASRIRFSDPPTQRQIDQIKASFTWGRRKAKAEIRAARRGAE